MSSCLMAISEKEVFFFQIDDETQAQMKKFRDLPQVTRQNPSTPGFPLESVCH